MKKIPVKKVYFDFVGSSMLASAVERSSYAKPSRLEDYMKRHHTMSVECDNETDVEGLTLYVSMDANKGEISMIFHKWEDIFADDFDVSRAPEVLADFKISLPRVCGPKEWKTYLDEKAVFAGEIKNVFDGEAAWRSQENLHNALALRLTRWLERKGLVDEVYFDDSEEFSISRLEFARELIMMFTDYRAMYRNPQAIMNALGVKGPV